MDNCFCILKVQLDQGKVCSKYGMPQRLNRLYSWIVDSTPDSVE